MFLKALFKDSSPFVQVLMLLAVIGICFAGTSILTLFLILFKFGFSLDVMKDIQLNMLNYPDLLRETQFLQVVGVFILPAIICAYLFSDNYKEYLRIDTPIHLPAAVWAFISAIVAIPFLNLTYYFNQQMVFPEALKGLETWIRTMEDAGSLLLEKMLYADNWWTLIFNIIVVCVLAGIGEEFIFRGVLQNLFGRVMKNPHAVIWIVAILFSAIHFQFYGFITRMLLGAWLGYLLYYTKTLWIPVLVHFTNNLVSTVIYYIFQDSPQELQEMDSLGTGSTWWLAVASLALFVFCFGRIRKQCR
jgi:membrane protease YdiL (CAAX protease family)